MTTKGKNTVMLSKIRHSGFGNLICIPFSGEQLLDFHVLDNGTVYYRFYSSIAKMEGTKISEIKDFESDFDIELQVFINQS